MVFRHGFCLCSFARDDFNIKVLQAFVELHEFADLNLVQALRSAEKKYPDILRWNPPPDFLFEFQAIPVEFPFAR